MKELNSMIKILNNKKDLKLGFALRKEVFVKEQNVPLDVKDFKLAKIASDMDFSYQVGHIMVVGIVHQKDYSIHHFELKFTDF